MEEQWNSSSSSSSIDNNSCNPSISSQSSFTQSTKRRGFTTTDLRLGLSLSPSSSHHTSPYSRDNESDWAPIKPDIRSLFVKVYMEGIPIGRKLDLLLHDSYQSLIKALRIMFKTTIISPDATQQLSAKAAYVLTYEDKEGDWMMVGDVSWEFFLTTVRKLKITRVDNC